MSRKAGSRKTGRRLLYAGGFLLAALLIAGALNYGRLVRLYTAVTLFEPDRVEENFRTMTEQFEARVVKSGEASPFAYELKELPASYTYRGEEKRVGDFIDRTMTTGLVVMKGDTVLYEAYFRGNTEHSLAISWSVAKSVVSALVGIAVDEGLIDISRPVTDYLPGLAGSGYDGVRVKDVLQMSSGVRFNEDYADFSSDINRMGRAFALNTPLKKIVASLEREREPGTVCHYVSMDTQVLGMILTEATGMELSRYMEQKLWAPMGAESDARWLIDSEGMEMVFGGLNAVLRDYARFGLLYANGGMRDGRQIVPAAWVEASVTPDAPHLMPGSNPDPDWTMGYGYQWWIPEGGEGDFMAIGIYGQAVYVNPRYQVVIAKTSAYADYDTDGEEMEMESVEFFRAIARALGE
jgi:CubicO group peptidase (beta-lactamase class C family)